MAVTGEQIRHIRSGLLFTGGLGAFIYEVATGGDRPTILILAAAMMGLPAFLRVDESRSKPPAERGGEG